MHGKQWNIDTVWYIDIQRIWNKLLTIGSSYLWLCFVIVYKMLSLVWFTGCLMFVEEKSANSGFLVYNK